MIVYKAGPHITHSGKHLRALGPFKNKPSRWHNTQIAGYRGKKTRMMWKNPDKLVSTLLEERLLCKSYKLAEYARTGACEQALNEAVCPQNGSSWAEVCPDRNGELYMGGKAPTAYEREGKEHVGSWEHGKVQQKADVEIVDGECWLSAKNWRMNTPMVSAPNCWTPPGRSSWRSVLG